MHIDSIYIINLNRRTDLRDAQKEKWMSLGFEEEKVNLFEASDGLLYKTREALINAAIADGFSFFERWFEFEGQHWVGNGWLAIAWSWSRLLRHVSNLPENRAYICGVADRYSLLNREQIDNIVSQLPNFKFFQFEGYIAEEGDPTWGFEGWYGRTIPPHFVNIQGLPEHSIEQGMLRVGDGLWAMTPQGAAWMLSICSRHIPTWNYEEAGHLATRMNPTEPGVYSAYYDYHNPDACWTETQFPGPLGGDEYSDIRDVNRITDTGIDRNKWENKLYVEGVLKRES